MGVDLCSVCVIPLVLLRFKLGGGMILRGCWHEGVGGVGDRTVKILGLRGRHGSIYASSLLYLEMFEYVHHYARCFCCL